LHVGKEVRVRELAGEVGLLDGGAPIAMHGKAHPKREMVTFTPHRQGIPLRNAKTG
jgi:hypothetical protein